uniref:Transposable element Tc1 transposase n=1 Tax=Amphiprion ocellaris TaxID=80972 RepID=A0AAQ5Z9X1_AMPOC
MEKYFPCHCCRCAPRITLKPQSPHYTLQRHWSSEMWKKVIWSDESSFTILSVSGRVHVWHKPGEQYRHERLTPTVKGFGGSIMLFAFMAWGRLILLREGSLQIDTKLF